MDIQLSLNKIADALKVNLIYENGKVTGTADLAYCPLPGFEMPIKLTVHKLFANDAVGVLAHVVGDLYLVVSHFAKAGAVNVFLIDGNKLSMDGVKAPPMMFVSKSMTIKQVVGVLRGAIVASFIWKDRRWSVLKLPT